MSEHIPGWVFSLFGLGSPVQELLNRWVPERFRPVTLWAVAALIVAAVVIVTPLDWADFLIQLSLVYAALTSGWAMSKVVVSDAAAGTGAKIASARAMLILGSLVGIAVFLPAIVQAQFDSLVVVEPEGTGGMASTIASFVWAQVASFIGATLTRWFSKRRRKG